MLRRWSIGMIVVAFLVMAAIPAGAAPAEEVSYVVAECPQAGNPQNVERYEFPTEDRVLIRGAQNVYDEYVFEAAGWRLIGTNETVANGNATLPEFVGPFWGTFDFQDDGTIGSFEGTWSWGNSAYGRATGKSADGKLAKITLGLDPTGYLPLPSEDCGVAEFLIVNPHG